jgi:hypothetical protein
MEIPSFGEDEYKEVRHAKWSRKKNSLATGSG